MSELLAPAGNEECAYAAINAGADAIYVGLTSFSARSSAENFDFAALQKLADYAHFLGARVHVAMNTLIKQGEVQQFLHDAVLAHNAGADAIIIQDMYLGAYLKKLCPQICLHLSTQAGVCNAYGARLAKQLGFSRVILARETSFADIAEIAKIIETEVFVQGALCTCFSGQCYFSSFAGGNSGNRGRCKQPCRKLYSIDRKGFEQPAYRLSPSDLCAGENILKYSKSGVYSFKIEGRMRRAEYVSAAVRYYRGLLDGNPQKDDLSALKRTYNRGNYTKGLAFGQDDTFLSSAVQGHIGEYVGTVMPANGKYVVNSRERCTQGDCFKILRGGSEVAGAVYAGQTKGGFIISSRVRLKAGDKVFITTDTALNARLLEGKRLKPINVRLTAAKGQPLTAQVDGETFASSFVVQQAVNRPTAADDLVRAFSKKDNYPFSLEHIDVSVEDGAFVPASLLNEFRRSVYSAVYLKPRKDIVPCDENMPFDLPASSGGSNKKVCIAARTLNGVKADIGILRPDDYFADLASLTQGFQGEKFLYLPPFLKGEEIEALKPVICSFDGIYCGGNYSALLARELGVKLFLGTGANLSNTVALSLVSADYVALSKELTYREAQPLYGGNTFMLVAGGIKVMDLIYCPFGRTCSGCDRRPFYTLTDEGERAFILRRYHVGKNATGECRFEIYNCASLVGECGTGSLYDFTCTEDIRGAMCTVGDVSAQRTFFKNYTKGHGETPVL